MDDPTTIWHLFAGDTHLATLTLLGRDGPFIRCSFAPEPAFAEVAPLFDHAHRLALDPDASMDAVWAYHSAHLAPLDLHLRPVSGQDPPSGAPLLQIRGGQAWFRAPR